jgi:hypothetical protein
MKLESETLREIISDHVFYALIIIGITISIYHALPVDVWKDSWKLIVFLGACGLTLDYLSFAKSLQLKNIIDYMNSGSTEDVEDPFEEVDKETTKEQK